MSEPRRKIGCVLVAHGTVAQCLMDAVEGILGKQSNWVAISNAGLSLTDLTETVDAAIADLGERCDVVVMSDMPGGSCHHACQETMGDRPLVRMLSGMNLMMLLEFFVKRDRQALDELLPLVKTRGQDAIRIL